MGNNIYNDKILERIGELFKISKRKLILETDKKFDLSIFNKNTNWRFISSLISTYSQNNFIFETDMESLQINLISKFGERVNLGLIDPFQVGLIEWSRRKIIQNWKYLLISKIITILEISQADRQ